MQTKKVSDQLEILCLVKYYEIERENKILLEKMSNIMQDTKPKLYNPRKTYISKLKFHRSVRDWQP
jgi:hypothetical protein